MRFILGLRKREYFVEIDNIINGKYLFVYVSPEKLLSEHFISILESLNIAQIAIDEAHCISMWGFDFRPAYRKIGEVLNKFPDIFCIALTASATDLVIKDIKNELGLNHTKVKRVSLSRRNLRYAVLNEESIHAKLLELCKKIEGSGLIYTRSRKACVELSELLKFNDLNADYYHAGLDIKERSLRQKMWMSDEIRIMVCTSAFGMGVDKPDVRFVLHAEPPENLAYYYQEAGRAGRDGKRSYAGLLYNSEQIIRLQKRYLNQQIKSDELVKVYDDLYSYFQIGEGVGEGLSYSFSPKKLVDRSPYSTNIWHTALSLLRMHEIISFSKDFKSTSSIQILTDQLGMEGFEKDNEPLKRIIQIIVRKYAGVYNGLTRIDEGFIAKEASLPERVVKQYLVRLNDLQLITYQAYENENTILFLKDRIRNFIPDQAKLKMLEGQKKMGYEGMIEYIEDDHSCRNQMISSYFGVHQDIPCGVCDHCKKLKKSRTFEHEFSKISLELKNLVDMDNNRENLLLELKNKPLHTLVLQELIERKIVYRDKGKIHWKESSK